MIPGIKNWFHKKKKGMDGGEAITAPDTRKLVKNMAQHTPENSEKSSAVQLPTVETAIGVLRGKIIEEITKYPAVNYRLGRLLWQDAADCFPDPTWRWDMVQFFLDLETGRLWAEASIYAIHHSPIDRTYSLSASDFAKIANKYQLSSVLQAFRTQEDWASLFDEHLKAAVDSARQKL